MGGPLETPGSLTPVRWALGTRGRFVGAGRAVAKNAWGWPWSGPGPPLPLLALALGTRGRLVGAGRALAKMLGP